MAMGQDSLSAEEVRRQAGYDASFTSAQRRLRDRAFLIRLHRRLAELDTEPRQPRLTTAQFLEQTSLER